MNPLVERKGFKLESIAPRKKKVKEKATKPIEHVKIIDDDAPVLWQATPEPRNIVDDDIVSFDDAPVIVGRRCVVSHVEHSNSTDNFL
jgi:hypothetical protein